MAPRIFATVSATALAFLSACGSGAGDDPKPNVNKTQAAKRPEARTQPNADAPPSLEPKVITPTDSKAPEILKGKWNLENLQQIDTPQGMLKTSSLMIFADGFMEFTTTCKIDGVLEVKASVKIPALFTETTLEGLGSNEAIVVTGETSCHASLASFKGKFKVSGAKLSVTESTTGQVTKLARAEQG